MSKSTLDLTAVPMDALIAEVSRRGRKVIDKHDWQRFSDWRDSHEFDDPFVECPPAFERIFLRMALGEDVTEDLAQLAYEFWGINALPLRPRKQA
jgi:hypothetical protein